jgi:hypothetical protein
MQSLSQNPPRKPKPPPPGLIARRIIEQCKKNKFLITSSFDVYMLTLLTKILPGKTRDFILDLGCSYQEIPGFIPRYCGYLHSTVRTFLKIS